MMIYEIVCNKVCHAICHMIFDCVEGQAEMLPKKSDRFSFILRGRKVVVEFNAASYFIQLEGGTSKLQTYTNYETTDDIAKDIIALGEEIIYITETIRSQL